MNSSSVIWVSMIIAGIGALSCALAIAELPPVIYALTGLVTATGGIVLGGIALWKI